MKPSPSDQGRNEDRKVLKKQNEPMRGKWQKEPNREREREREREKGPGSDGKHVNTTHKTVLKILLCNIAQTS